MIDSTKYNINKNFNLLNPNFLIDIYIKFVLIATVFYILYKYFLIDIIINNIIILLQKKINIYLPNFQNLKKNNEFAFKEINNYFTNYKNNLNTLPSTANPNVNDLNMAIIFSTMIVSLLIILFTIIYITDEYSNINYKNIGYSFLFNILFIGISQFILFYVIYSYIDPIALYKIFYTNYDIKPVVPDINVLLETNFNKLIELESLNPINYTNQTSIVNSSSTASIYIFINIFICICIITFVLSIINYLVLYNNYSITNSIIPFTKLSLYIYMIITFVSFILFIILLLLSLSRI